MIAVILFEKGSFSWDPLGTAPSFFYRPRVGISVVDHETEGTQDGDRLHRSRATATFSDWIAEFHLSGDSPGATHTVIERCTYQWQNNFHTLPCRRA